MLPLNNSAIGMAAMNTRCLRHDLPKTCPELLKLKPWQPKAYADSGLTGNFVFIVGTYCWKHWC